MSVDARSTIFREVNERIAEITGTWEWDAPQGFLCECDCNDCTESILLTRTQYEAIRAERTQTFTVPGHERADIERVVEHRDSFVVVEKLGAVQEQPEEDERTA